MRHHSSKPAMSLRENKTGDRGSGFKTLAERVKVEFEVTRGQKGRRRRTFSHRAV